MLAIYPHRNELHEFNSRFNLSVDHLSNDTVTGYLHLKQKTLSACSFWDDSSRYSNRRNDNLEVDLKIMRIRPWRLDIHDRDWWTSRLTPSYRARQWWMLRVANFTPLTWSIYIYLNGVWYVTIQWQFWCRKWNGIICQNVLKFIFVIAQTSY